MAYVLVVVRELSISRPVGLNSDTFPNKISKYYLLYAQCFINYCLGPTSRSAKRPVQLLDVQVTV